MSMCVDSGNPTVPIIYASWYDIISHTGFIAAVDANVQIVLAPTQTIATYSVQNITCGIPFPGACTTFYEVINNYGYDSSIPTHFINGVSCTQGGTIFPTYIVSRGIGLASKTFFVNGTLYFWAAYQSQYQPSYFLINATLSLDTSPFVAGKLAYENGGGYLPNGLPNVSVMGDVAQFPYLYKDLIAALTTNQNSIQDTTGGIYSQTGINLGTIIINNLGIDSAEIAKSLNISGGFLWQYDGYLPVEQNFFYGRIILNCKPPLVEVCPHKFIFIKLYIAGQITTETFKDLLHLFRFQSTYLVVVLSYLIYRHSGSPIKLQIR